MSFLDCRAGVLWFNGRPPCLLRSVIVNLRSDPDRAIRGVLWQVRGPWLVLRNTTLLDRRPGARTDDDIVIQRDMDGDIVIHRDNVTFLQVTPSE